MLPDTTRILRLDAIANVLGAAGLAAFAGALADPLALDAPWPLYVIAAVMAVYGLEQWIAAPHPSTAAVTAFAAADVVFAVGVGGWALVDPAGADTWARWAAGGVGELVLLVGIAKTVAWRRRSGAVEGMAQPRSSSSRSSSSSSSISSASPARASSAVTGSSSRVRS